MDAVPQGAGAPAADDRAVEFAGRWQEYAPIALTNFALTIVTLGIFRFWARARERRYLWSRTRLIGDPLEWSGTGGEMFVGFLIVSAMLIGVMLALGLVAYGIKLPGADHLFFVLVIGFYLGFLWFFNFAKFRALRYRLSRTWWRGIRGGSDDKGVSYANGSLGRNLLAGITAGIFYPHAIVGNWNARWNAMSFGPHRFESAVTREDLGARWFLVYLGFATFGLFAILVAAAHLPHATVFLGYLAFALAYLNFYALFFRKAAEHLRLGELTMELEADTLDWVKLIAGSIALTIVTLGVGGLFWHYRRWKFVCDRSRLYGFVVLDELSQSTTTAPRDAEGFADAFDIGAF